MRYLTTLFVLTITLVQSGLCGRDRVIWHDKPANTWQSEAFPLGNGRMGCMVFGGLKEERIQFNVDSLWTGDQNPKGAYETAGMGAYQNFGDLYISLGGSDTKVTVPSGQRAYYKHEAVEFSVDGNPATKWCIEHKGKPIVWQITAPDQKAVSIREYSFVSEPEMPSRDPKSWVLAGSNDGEIELLPALPKAWASGSVSES